MNRVSIPEKMIYYLFIHIAKGMAIFMKHL